VRPFHLILDKFKNTDPDMRNHGIVKACEPWEMFKMEAV
jgi:hypothetical protein